MAIKEKINAWVEEGITAWKDRLSGWMVSGLKRGIVGPIEDVEPGMKDMMHATLMNIVNNPQTPPELRDAIKKSLELPDWEKTFSGWVWGLIGWLPAMLSSGYHQGNLIGYDVARLYPSYRLDPITLTSIWLRDKPTYEQFWDDLRDQGWTEERIAIAKELANIIPPLADMTRFADFSAFDEEVIEKWRAFYDAPGWIKEPFSLLGVTGEWADKYWFSHWIQPGRYELSLMHRRGLITDDEVKLAYRTMGYSSYWQDKLLDLVKEVPTRVDVRRWWDMRTIDETRLREIYHAQGYYGKDLDDYVLWTKVYVAFPDLFARWKNGWITLDDVRAELTGYGMPADRLEELIETKITTAEPERTASERDLTKTEIYKGVKKGIITWGEGLELLMDLGYDEDEAEYILTVNVAVETGSPETYEEFKDLTMKWRKSTGMKSEAATEKIKQAAAEVVKLTRDLGILQARVKEEEAMLVKGEILPAAATAKRDELRVMLHRAESALSEAKHNYETLVAEWRHGKEL